MIENPSHPPGGLGSERRIWPGGRLSRQLARHLGGQCDGATDDAALLAVNFWLTPSAVPDIAEDQAAVIAAMRRIRRSPSAAAYKTEYRRAEAEHKRLNAQARQERVKGHASAGGRAADSSAPSAFQRAAKAAARCHSIQAAAANLWRKIARRSDRCAVAVPRLPVTRPRARRSHRVVARAAKASGDSGDSDGEPPRSRGAGIGTARTIASAEVV
jgi:hypothetical protein